MKRCGGLLERTVADGAVQLGLELAGATELHGELVVEGDQQCFQLRRALRASRESGTTTETLLSVY